MKKIKFKEFSLKNNFKKRINEKIKKGDYLNDKYMDFLNDTRFKYDTKNMTREERKL